MAKRTFVKFRHKTGTLKNIPGVANKEDLCPRLIQVVERVAGKERPVLKLDETFVPKIGLLDEEVEIRLTEKEQKLPKGVRERIMGRRAEEADLRIRANEMLKSSIKFYEDQGEIEVLDWEYVIDDSSPEAKGANITELSDIALADFADRGLVIPDFLKKTSMPAASTDKSGTLTKQVLTKKVKSED